jgi:hypothetical protein
VNVSFANKKNLDSSLFINPTPARQNQYFSFSAPENKLTLIITPCENKVKQTNFIVVDSFSYLLTFKTKLTARFKEPDWF